jgi:regulator of sigma E protease
MSIHLSQLFWFLVVTCVLVAWHEFGHFWVGRKCGVKVLRYAIGFGPALWKRTGKDGIEYAINALPLGGYVKFADTRDGSVEAHDLARAFDQVSLAKRSAIVLAGPLANLLFAIVAFALMYVVGVKDDRAVLGPTAGLAQAAGMVRGDEIIKIDGTDVGNWTTAGIELMQLGFDRQIAHVTVVNALIPGSPTRNLMLDLSALPPKFDEQGVLSVLGMEPYFFNPDSVISEFSSASPAQRAGLTVGERIVAVNGKPISDRKGLIESIQEFGKMRAGNLILTVAHNRIRRDVPVTAELTTIEGISAWRVGMLFERFETTRKLAPISAIGEGAKEAWYQTTRTLSIIKSLLTGKASLKNVSGPLTIAKYADESAKRGVSEFLRLLGAISLSLFIVNLLPVPVLDGGQLLFFAMEKIKGAPLGERAMEAGSIIGMLVLFGLMTLAFTNDISRSFGL